MKKIGLNIELQIYAIGLGWLLLALPPYEPHVRVPPHTAQVAKALSFALGKRFAVAASLSARAKLRPRLLAASGRLIPSPEIQVSTGLDSSRLGSKLPLAYLTPLLLISKIGCPFPLLVV